MEPEYNIGDIVIAKEVSEEELKVGDVISFREGESVVTHRITGELFDNGTRKFRTKGDNNNVEDYWSVSENAIEGKVINCIPGFGKITLMLHDKIVIICIIILFYGHLMQSEKVRKRNERRRNKRLQYEQNEKTKNTLVYNYN